MRGIGEVRSVRRKGIRTHGSGPRRRVAGVEGGAVDVGGRAWRRTVRECMCERTGAHWALLNTTTTESDPHHRRSGAMTKSRFALVIFVAANTVNIGSSKKLKTNRTTRTVSRRESLDCGTACLRLIHNFQRI